ncbi:MFS transporter [Malikia spinosa]|uniref:MFS transporter n=1 Tax=Malikia spinosa TaxID=86180 RepID=A0A7C9N162_9BURK|nr:MFS transporter [Malikia spinosa]MYZ50960.1 MFS transporter [Malikia spinosa]
MNPAAHRLPLLQLLICSSLILTLAMGIRHGFGLWMQPITQDQDWTREAFSRAIAVQNLSWGLFGIGAGMLADRWGGWRVLLGGALLWTLGLCGMALSESPLAFTLSTGVVIGAAQAASTYGVLYGIIGRQIAPEKRSWAMGVTGAAGSFGQFLLVPTEGWLISSFGWQQALLVLGASTLLIAPLALLLREPATPAAATGATTAQQGIWQAMREAMAYPSFRLLMAGYFVCGFQVVFIGVHLPSYLKDQGLAPQVASTALALIGLFNVFGSYGVGLLGQRWPKRYLLAIIYGTRSVAITLFLLAPLTPWSVHLFAAVMGLLWLSTVPPTNAIVAQIFGVRHFSMLSGFVFCSHQVGSFCGVWLGGLLYDRNGNYDLVWLISIGLGLFATAVSLPVRETAIQRAPQRVAASAP